MQEGLAVPSTVNFPELSVPSELSVSSSRDISLNPAENELAVSPNDGDGVSDGTRNKSSNVGKLISMRDYLKGYNWTWVGCKKPFPYVFIS